MLHATPLQRSAGLLAVAVAIFFASTVLAESDYKYESIPPGPFHHPVAPYPVEMGFSQDHSSTAYEGAQRGRAAVIQAWGNYQLSTSQARILWEQARWLDRENDLKLVQAAQARQEMLREGRVRNREVRDAARNGGQKKLAERQATVYRHTYRLSSNELDMNMGTIKWPAVLQASKFQDDRARVEELLRQVVSYGDPQQGAAQEIAGCTDRLIKALRADSQVLPRAEYLAAQRFLRGLKFEANALVDT